MKRKIPRSSSWGAASNLAVVNHKRRWIKQLRADGATVPGIIRRMKLSKASVYRALNA
jgi:hypothetical protein